MAQKNPRSVFVKVDIEGWEYRILDDLLKNAPIIIGMVIEFYSIDLHMEKIEKFVSLFPLEIVHVHANNYGPRVKNNFPSVIEVTFSSQKDFAGFASLPNPLDRPNNPRADEYEIVFA